MFFKKVFGIFPTRKTGQYVKVDKFIKKLNVESKKGTNVVSISYKSKKKDLAYGVVSSVVKNYIELHKELLLFYQILYNLEMHPL